jgi:hypothetical protein
VGVSESSTEGASSAHFDSEKYYFPGKDVNEPSVDSSSIEKVVKLVFPGFHGVAKEIKLANTGRTSSSKETWGILSRRSLFLSRSIIFDE